jgi:hypothetical protein
VRTLLASEGVHRLHLLTTHIWDGQRPYALLQLPALLAAAGGEFVTVHLTNLLRNLFFCAATASIGGIGTLAAATKCCN